MLNDRASGLDFRLAAGRTDRPVGGRQDSQPGQDRG
jgi:hypothetical protein